MTVPLPPAPERRPTSPLAAFLAGWRQVLRAPAVLFGTWLVWWGAWQLGSAATTEHVVAVPYAPRDVGVEVLRRWLEPLSLGWAPELAPYATPSEFHSAMLPAFVLLTAMWLFLSGGILDRYARARPIRTAAFFAACGVYCFRFVRLAALVAVAVYVVWRVAMALPSIGSSEITGLASIVVLGLLVDFARVRAVVEDRHSMIGATAAAVRFIRRRVWRVAGLLLLNGVAVLALETASGWLVALPATPSGVPWLMGIVWLARTVARLACLASEVAFFQGELAHAGYTAAPLPLWPDSPAVEAMDNLVRSQQRPEDSGLR